jgi:hypothetical protein
VADGDARRAMVALIVAFGVAPCVAAALGAARNGADDSLTTRSRTVGVVALATFAGAWTAVAVAGRPSLVGATAVVAGGAVAAFGAATLVRAWTGDVGRAILFGAGVPIACAAALFVADPFIEWTGSTTAEAPSRAALVVAVNPVASMATDVGIDWQRSQWLYDGPPAGAPGVRATPGLSVAGQYYPSRPTSTWSWALVAAAFGFGAVAASRKLPR